MEKEACSNGEQQEVVGKKGEGGGIHQSITQHWKHPITWQLYGHHQHTRKHKATGTHTRAQAGSRDRPHTEAPLWEEELWKG